MSETDLAEVWARSLDELPKPARSYVQTIAELSGVPVGAVGVGPGREQTLLTGPAR